MTIKLIRYCYTNFDYKTNQGVRSSTKEGEVIAHQMAY